MRKFIIAATVIFLAVLASDIYPGLRGGGGWQWPLFRPENVLPVVVLAGLLLLYLLIASWVYRRGTFITLAFAVLSGAILSLAVVGVNGDPFFHLFTRTVSPVQTGASALAVRIMAQEEPDNALRRWPQIMDEALSANLIHFTTSPPGQPLLHHTLAQLFDTVPAMSQPVSMALRPYQCSDLQVMNYTRGELVSAGIGMLMPLWAALAAIPLYFAVRDLSGDGLVARRVILWFPLVPSVLLFAPTWNTLYPALCVAAFALLVRGLMRRQMVYVLLSGLVMSFTTFLNFAVLPVLLLFGLFTLGYWYFVSDQPKFLWAIKVGLWFGAGLISIWIVFTVLTGVNPLDILQMTFSSHQELVQRNYFEWLILHPYDVTLFMGLPLVALAVWGMVLAFRRSRPNALDVAAIATALTIILLNLSGIVQGENGRILSFYAPFLLIAATRVMMPSPTRTNREHMSVSNSGDVTSSHSLLDSDLPSMGRGLGGGVNLLLAAQALTVLVMASTLYTVPLDLNPQPTSPRTDIGGLGDSLAFNPSGAVFSGDGQFMLDQYRYIGDPGAQAITFEFQWQGVERTERPYQFEMVAYAENEIDGKIQSEPFHWYAQGGNYLPTCWRSGDQIRDTVVLPLPPVSMPVVWDVRLRAVDERTGNMMSVDLPDNSTSDYAPLGPVKYP